MKFPKVLVVCIGMLSATTALSEEPRSHGEVSKSCKGLTGKSLQECLTVARKMEASASDVAKSDSAPSASQDPNYVNHSSAVMDTPEQKAASAAVKKGKDPKAAVEKLPGKSDKASKPED